MTLAGTFDWQSLVLVAVVLLPVALFKVPQAPGLLLVPV
jgi:hypothetical protein